MAGPQQGRVVDLREVSLTLGRGRDNDLVLEGDGISRRHGAIICENGLYFVEDNQSTNGIRLNGQCITKREELHAGDKIGVGTHIIQLTDIDTAVNIPDISPFPEPLPEMSPVAAPAAPVPWVQIILIVALVGCIGFIGWVTFVAPPVPPAVAPSSPRLAPVVPPPGDLPPAAVPEPEVNPGQEAAVEPAPAPAVNPSPTHAGGRAAAPAESGMPAPVVTAPAAAPVEAQAPAVTAGTPAETAPATGLPATEVKPEIPAPAPVIPLFEVVRLEAMLKAGTAQSLVGQVIRVRGVPVTFGKAGTEVHLLFPGNIHCVFSAEQFTTVRPAIRAAQKANQPIIIRGTVTPSPSGDGVVIGDANLTP